MGHPLDSWLPFLLGPYGVVVLLAILTWILWKDRKETREKLERELAAVRDEVKRLNEARLQDAQANGRAMEEWNEEMVKTVSLLKELAEEMTDRVSQLPSEDLPGDPRYRTRPPQLPKRK